MGVRADLVSFRPRSLPFVKFPSRHSTRPRSFWIGGPHPVAYEGPAVISLTSSSFFGVTRRRYALSRLAKIQSRLHLGCFNFRNAGR